MGGFFTKNFLSARAAFARDHNSITIDRCKKPKTIVKYSA
jgi:hypothetical protein